MIHLVGPIAQQPFGKKNCWVCLNEPSKTVKLVFKVRHHSVKIESKEKIE